MAFTKTFPKNKEGLHNYMHGDRTFFNILSKAAGEHGINLAPASMEALEKYYLFLNKMRKKMNLIGNLDEQEIARDLFLDSLLGLLAIPDMSHARLLDVGCGAGFPGLVLKIARPEIRLSLLDSAEKKIDFVREASAVLALENVEFINERAEKAGHMPDFREKFDVAASKALADIPALLELCAPFVRVGGKFIAWKGIGYKDEITILEDSRSNFGLELRDVRKFSLDKNIKDTFILVFEKVAQIQDRYPRSYQAIQRKKPSKAGQNGQRKER
jgi:16S rRNA (guanine527-N7)-methyltransferase